MSSWPKPSSQIEYRMAMSLIGWAGLKPPMQGADPKYKALIQPNQLSSLPSDIRFGTQCHFVHPLTQPSPALRSYHMWSTFDRMQHLTVGYESDGLEYGAFTVFYTPYKIPDELVEHYVAKSGFQCPDVRLIRLVAVATQKFIAEVASDALQHCKARQSGAVKDKRDKQQKDKRLTLTMDDLSKALREGPAETMTEL
ncbi:Transcription initiation factor TFIID [Macleaya cordata]|uniref:Transcription initiation factor TFIID n=1 Tax=Macleaya cordata TaxID=56857 RepID=A0A200QU13_MACCD|nr:Transcription initiation factor TFIID [Macleaya cordata]